MIDTTIAQPVTPDPTQVQVWNITTDKKLEEGEDVLVTVTTENVPDGAEVTYYMIGAGISASDFVSDTLSDTLVIKNNAAVFVLGIEDDLVKVLRLLLLYYKTKV